MAESTPEKLKSTPPSKPVKAAPVPQEVIARSARVRELPAPPMIEPPPIALVNRSADPVLPPPLPPVDLQAIDIRVPGQLAPRRRYRLPGPLIRWMIDPERRGAIGFVAAGFCHVVLFAVLAFTIRNGAAAHDEAPLNAREICDRAIYLARIAPPVNIAAKPASGSGDVISALTVPNRATPSVPPPAVASVAPQTPPPSVAPVLPKATAPPPDEPSVSPEAAARALNEKIRRKQAEWLRGDFRRRSPAGRSEGSHYFGGDSESEQAVDRGIVWLLAHQRPSGGWSFDHTTDQCMGYCLNPGSETSATAATGMALLPMLGAGYTHRSGPYQVEIGRALAFIRERGFKISYGTDFRDGSMYGHALATIALCECYGMTHDADLREAAQGAIDFVAYCQDTHSGGWRYNPSESGDTTVTAWMLMALKSGQMAGLNVPSPCFDLATKFLDSVQSADGSQYGYIDRRSKPATSAAGLLCRMYLGWQRDRPAIGLGVAQLKKWKASQQNLYFDYYATQVMFHCGGADWLAWNKAQRDYLVSNQDRQGHANGSWYFKSEQSAAGGRLYNTAMAIMILEVYYRHMPLYTDEAVPAK